MSWFLIVVVITGQPIALGEPSEAQCLADLEKIRAGVHRTVVLEGGVRLPITRAVECITEAEWRLRRDGGT